MCFVRMYVGFFKVLFWNVFNENLGLLNGLIIIGERKREIETERDREG